MKHSQIHRRQQYVNISNLVLMEHIVSFQAHTFRTDPLKDKELPFLPPPPPCPRLTSVPTRTNHQSTTQTPQRCHKRHASWFFFLILNHTQSTLGNRKMLKKPAQRKPAKGNGAPQTAYPVSAAFNRMLLCASLSLSLRVKQEKGCTRGKSLWNVYFAVFAKKKKDLFLHACVCPYVFNKVETMSKSELDQDARTVAPKPPRADAVSGVITTTVVIITAE